MCFPYFIDVPRRIAVVTLSGTVHGEDIAQTVRELYRDPLWQRGFDALWDGRGITDLRLERTDVCGFARLQRQFADVAAEGEDVLLMERIFDYAMASFYESLASRGPRPARVCRSEAEARILLEQRHEPYGASAHGARAPES